MTLTTPFISDKLTAKWPEVGSTNVFMSTPPTASEEAALILVCELLLIMYYEDPNSIGGPNDEPRKTWDAMLGSSHAEKIAAGVVALSP